MNSAPCYFQKTWFYNYTPVSGLSSHINLLEAFDPNKSDDPDRWIPTGLYYDLLDGINENTPITDRATGYTNANFFNGLDNDVVSMVLLKSRLIQENGNDQNLINLFALYHY